mmetsp:Transcript_20485/g.28610  ORF Transcript_20485/g.28610 Transcript_20485/m.28610 type:complete len:1253 (+) Transcript_20485:76-3834(+)|eukprot:CAMPEP_0184484722 /NCGR_PEP_ID=MMETSP0113_2-20130426/6399_1 /TAXON_ID=91329 /ORGANISM="Norrisiella sphaerica, Strain BC52" /LENGTH=1252 /DNA_ID=CAMNT_0026865829 /DNA_START=82 /DNA_END=3840 /DNA_ORIENTATION=-
MLVKFENKSHRVKGLAFHPRRPWVLASLHNGVIELWDYRMDTKIDEFCEHEGPVRGVDFHSSRPLFVSGGDDYKIKVWNYQLKRCLFTLNGHLDYIRTVQFHNNYPWILSASDDQTIRMWNWQSRSCLIVLTGHNHYVMSAQFHPTKDLVLSASLDQTARVWDISGLRKKTVSPMAPPESGVGNDMFGVSDVGVKHVLEGHSRGVNWASFHPTMPYIATAADDREVKLWRMNDDKAWEVDTMRGHINNVSCVLFHPRKDLIISNSEDKSIRVWDMNKESAPQVLRRENDRYWILAVHPTLNLIGAGHDSGMVVFKLERERPAYDCSPSHKRMYYFNDNYIFEHTFRTQSTGEISSQIFRRSSRINEKPRTLIYNYSNRQQHCVLLLFEPMGTYELHVSEKKRGGDFSRQTTHKGFAKSAAFVSRNRFAVLDKNRQIWQRDLKNEVKKKINIPGLVVNHIFPAGLGRILLRTPDSMVLYDIQAMKVVGELRIQSRHQIKYVVWSAKHKYVAMFSKSNIHIAKANLDECCFTFENSRIKSGAWDDDTFVYNTATHIKYLLPNGDKGIIRTIEDPVYICQISPNSTELHYLNREKKCGVAKIDPTEYVYKVAVTKCKYRTVVKIMRSGKLVGKSIIAYLQKKGFPEVALHFVKDEKIKFQLALQCGNITSAKESAEKLEKIDPKSGKACWEKLGVEALRQGVCHIVEEAYMKTSNFDRLSFLYTITGNTANLKKMLNIASKFRRDKNAIVSQFHNTLYLGDVESRVECLRKAGMQKLAYITAVAHGLNEAAEALGKELKEDVPQLPDLSGAKLFKPPVPIIRTKNKQDYNWPLVEVSSGYFDGIDIHNIDLNAPEPEKEDRFEDEDEDLDMETKEDLGGWMQEEKKKQSADGGGGGGDGWGGGDDGFDFGDIVGADATEEVEEKMGGEDESGDFFVMPSSGKGWDTKWSESSNLAGDLAASGQFDMALHSLNRQIGAVNFEPLESRLIDVHNMSHASLPMMFGMPSIAIPLQRMDSNETSLDLPRLCYSMSHCVDMLQQAYKLVTSGNFPLALETFRSILATIPVLEISSQDQEKKLVDLKGICREYITGLRLEAARRQAKDPAAESALAAYFSRCRMQPMHQVRALLNAVKIAFKMKNYKATASFCRRILEICVSGDKAQLSKIVKPAQIRALLKKTEGLNTDAVPVDYREGETLVLDCKLLKPLAKGAVPCRCPYCFSTYSKDGATCVTCQIGKVGADVTPYRPKGGNFGWKS